MSWQLLAFIFSFFGAGIIHVNHVFKMDGFVTVFLRAFFIVGLGLPVFLFLPIPTETSFYIWAILSGSFITIGDVLLLNAAAHHGGRLTSMYIPMKIFMVFILWSFIAPESFFTLAENPLNLIGVIACFTVITMAMANFRRNDASWQGLLAVVPVAACFTLADVVVKEAVSAGNVLAGAVMFMVVSSAASGLVSAIWLKFKRKENLKNLFTTAHIKGAFVMGVLLLVGVSVLIAALALSPNPAYVGAITVTSTVWLTIYYKVFRGDDASLKASMVMVASALTLLLLTA